MQSKHTEKTSGHRISVSSAHVSIPTNLLYLSPPHGRALKWINCEYKRVYLEVYFLCDVEVTSWCCGASKWPSSLSSNRAFCHVARSHTCLLKQKQWLYKNWIQLPEHCFFFHSLWPPFMHVLRQQYIFRDVTWKRSM